MCAVCCIHTNFSTFQKIKDFYFFLRPIIGHIIFFYLVCQKKKDHNLNYFLQVLEQDDANVAVLVQRALLYESMEKYRLGAEDLRTVLKHDPSNRLARSTIHRLNKLAD